MRVSSGGRMRATNDLSRQAEYCTRYYPDTTGSFVPSGSVLHHSILGSVCMDTNGPKDLMVPDTYSLAGIGRDR